MEPLLCWMRKHCTLNQPKFPFLSDNHLSNYSKTVIHLRLNWCGWIISSTSPPELFSVLEIKQEYFHNNRYLAIPCVVSITTILPIVCICLRAISDPPSQFPGMTRCTAVHTCGHLHSSISHCIFMCAAWVVRICNNFGESVAKFSVNRGQEKSNRFIYKLLMSRCWHSTFRFHIHASAVIRQFISDNYNRYCKS